MEPRFIRWMLLLLFLTIVAAEGLRTAVDEGKPSSSRVRGGGSRFSSRKTGTSTDSSSEASPANSETIKTTAKPSRFSSTRKATSKRQFGHTTPGVGSAGGNNANGSTHSLSKVTTEHSLPKSRIEAALQRRAEKLKTNSQKSQPHGLRIPIRKLGQKGQTPEPEKPVANSTESAEEEKEEEDRKYLPEGLSEDAKNAKEEEDVDGIEAPKVSEAPVGRLTGQRTTRLNDRSKQKSESTGPVFTPAPDSRSRTGRKIQSQSVLSAKQLKSSVPSSSRFAKTKVTEDSEVEEVTDAVEAGSNRRSFEVEAPFSRRKLIDSHNKYDIAASGSESVRINIPLSLEDSKRLSGSSNSDDLSSVPPKRPALNQRYKARSRQTFDEKKPEAEVSSTESAPTRGISRRFKSSTKAVSQESSTEAATQRTRGRHYESRKSNTIADSSPSTPKPDTKRRNFHQKSTTRNVDAPKVPETDKPSETKHQNVETRKPIRSRVRGRGDASSSTTSTTTTQSPVPSPSPTFFSPTFFNPTVVSNFGTITPSFEPEIIQTTTPLAASPATTTTRPSAQPAVSSAPASTEINRNDGEAEETLQENAGQRRRASKEDFFNHGLGFRGRRPPIPGASDVPAVITTPTTSAPAGSTTLKQDVPRGNPGWTLRRRPGNWNDGPAPSGPSPGPIETPVPAERTTTPATANLTPKAGRRGNKTYSKAGSPGGPKSDEGADNDNYPPDFKARIAQFQKTGGAPRAQTEEPQLQTSSNVTGSASADLEFAPSDNEYLVVTQTADPISTTTLSLQIPSLLEEQQVSET